MTLKIIIVPLLLVSFTTTQCPRQADDEILAKIKFDYSALDDAGLVQGERALDYEFCIPATADASSQVKKIEAEVRILENAPGRVKCTTREWLCIVSTHRPDWKAKLYQIAALPFVHQIQETHYE